MKKYYSAIPNNIEMPYPIGLLYAFNGNVHKYERPSWADSLFIDSGGYVAWKRGKPIDIDKYHEFLDMNKSAIDMYAALDEIGDEKKSIELYDYSLSCGFSPIPVFHEGDNVETLNHYMKRTEHIGVAAINKGSRPKKCRFLDMCLSSIPDDYNVHGFGFFDTHIMQTYDLDSVDGTYAFRLARFGMVITPMGTYRFADHHRAEWEHEPLSTQIREYMDNIGIEYEKLKSHERDGMIERLRASIWHFEQIEPKGNINDYGLF